MLIHVLLYILIYMYIAYILLVYNYFKIHTKLELMDQDIKCIEDKLTSIFHIYKYEYYINIFNEHKQNTTNFKKCNERPYR